MAKKLRVGFLTEFCYKRVIGNRDETNFVIPRNKVVNSRNSVFRGMAYFVLRNETKLHEKVTSLQNKRTMLNVPTPPPLNFRLRPFCFYPSDSASFHSPPPTPPPCFYPLTPPPPHLQFFFNYLLALTAGLHLSIFFLYNITDTIHEYFPSEK